MATEEQMQPLDDEAPQAVEPVTGVSPQAGQAGKATSEASATTGALAAGAPATPNTRAVQAPADTEARPGASVQSEAPAETPPVIDGPEATPATTTTTTTARRPLTPMAAFDRIPLKWLAVAGGAVLLLMIGLATNILLTSPGRTTSASPVTTVPGSSATSDPGQSGSGATGPSASAGASNGTGTGTGTGTGPGAGAAPGGGNQAAPAGPPPTSVDALKALLIDPPGTDSTVDTEPIDDTTFAGARWGVSLFWANPEGSMVLAQYSTPDEARSAIGQYLGSVHDSGICDPQPVSGRPDAFVCAAKGLGGVSPGDIPAIGLGLRGTVVALITATDPTNVQQLLVKQLDRLP
jgi:hypothetical protein